MFWTFGVFLLPVLSVCAQNSWTNKAGHVLIAVPVSINGSQVQFTNSARSVVYPLSVFLPSEQARIKATLGVADISKEDDPSRAACDRALKRLRVLYEAGKLSGKEYKDRCDAVRRVFQ